MVAACVILPPGVDRRREALRGLDDSKRLTAGRRERLYDGIRATALASALGVASVEEIDSLNILQASLLAMRRAVEAAIGQAPPGSPSPDLVAVDGDRTPGTSFPERAFVGGDGRSLNIAAASVLAKVARDRLMVALAERHPGYGFEVHKGYPTAVHRAALLALGPCAAHRRSFRPVAQAQVLRSRPARPRPAPPSGA